MLYLKCPKTSLELTVSSLSTSRELPLNNVPRQLTAEALAHEAVDAKFMHAMPREYTFTYTARWTS
ncbi:hypothetical protein PG996_002734 [Apiospora saccharicola]|uniref:Uncharacterized protein n=1 Tax=Apiospora saccharicola TaxID=335842 RepID=A0ABR1WKC0_9PEZI